MNLKSKSGSVAVFVFVAILFIAGVLMLMFASGMNRSETIDKQLDILNTIYTSPNNDLNLIYNKINSEENNISNVSWLSGTEKTQIGKTDLKTEEKRESETKVKGYLSQKINNITYKVPIPNNFYYVGGTIDTGLIISDDANDAGRGINNDDNLTGNQFVWIPIQLINTDTTNITNSNMQQSANVYGGFFIGRYMTKTDNAGNVIIKNTGTDYTTITDEIAQSKYIEYVNSYLCTDVIWNMTITFINTKNSDWTVNPKNNIYTKADSAETEIYSYRMVLFVQI